MADDEQELEPECNKSINCPAPWHHYECRKVEPFLFPERFWKRA